MTDNKIQVKSQMSQKANSSMMSGTQMNASNAQLKYQKALKQIGKLIDTNKALKSQSQQKQYMLTTELSDMALRLADMEHKYEESEIANHRMHEVMEEMQDTNQELRKQYNTLQRQVGYLNEVLAEQNAQLKKLSVFKDEKGISQLLRSYQQREQTHKQEINRLQDQVLQLKTTIDRIEQDLMQETQMRQRYEEQYNIIGLEINKYRELNNYLMDKNQHILSDERNRNDRGMMSQHQVEGIVVQLKRQLQILRNLQYQAEDISEKQYVKNYQLLIEQKNSISLLLARTKDQLTISEEKINQLYEVEEKMSTALVRSDILQQENNMLKNRITILQSKEIIDNVGFYDDSDLKMFEDKISFMMNKNDPLNTIKNSDDNTHFIQMKSYITDLQTKLQSVIEQKQSIEKKYKNIKMKFIKKAEENIILEESNKLLKGKLQGYERLAEKLNYELEKSMQAHEDEIVKMVAITNNLVSKKVEESRNASVFIKSQFDLQLQKAERVEKTMSQELDTLKLENGTLKIKLTDVQEKQRQSSELLQIYQTKFNDLSGRYKQLEQENTSINEKVIKYEQLYQEEKARHETILLQKQAVSSKLNLISEQLNERTHQLQDSLRQKELTYESETKRTRQQLIRYKQQLESLSSDNKILSHQITQHRATQNKTVSSLKEENSYIRELQNKWNELKQLNNVLESQLISLRTKINSFDEVKRRLEEVEEELMRKSDELNDLKRHNLGMKKEIDSLNNACNDYTQHNNHLISQINTLKLKLSQPISLSSLGPKQLQHKKTIQRLHEQIAILQSGIRDQKRNSARYMNDLHQYKQEIQHLQQIINKNKHREQTLLQTISNSNNDLLTVQDELFQFKSKHAHALHNATLLGQELDSTTQNIHQVADQLNSTKNQLHKLQTNNQHLIKDLNSTKQYLQQAQKFVKRLNSIQRLEWEQQREKDNLSSLVQTLNRILKNTESFQFSNKSSNQEYSFVPASSFGNLQSNYFVQASSPDNFRISSGQNYSRNQFLGGSFGNSDENVKNIPITNDTFRQYSGSLNSDSTTNLNFSSESFARPSQPFNASSPYRTFEQV